MYDVIVPIGFNCNITFLLGHNNLKKESSLFEWFETKSFSDIVDVLEKISNSTDDIQNIPINIIPNIKNHGVIIEKDSIFSAHYNVNYYRDVFNRRCKRLFNDMKTAKRILFIRVKKANNLDNNDVIRLKNLIHKINPNIEKLNLLLIADHNYPIDPKINDEIVIKKYISINMDTNTFKMYDENIKSIEEFSNIMQEFGYPKNISKYEKNPKV